MIKFKNSWTIILLALLLGWPLKSAQASYSLIYTGSEVMESGDYRLGAEFQALTGSPTGLNFLALIDLPLPHPSMDYRIKLGSGSIGSIGGALRWIPIPDLLTQPAVGGIFDIEWTDTDSDGLQALNFRIAPLISKNFNWEHGLMTPYGALPIGLKFITSDINDTEEDPTQAFIQMILGLEVGLDRLENVRFIAETGFSVKSVKTSETYFSLSASLKMP